MFYTEVFDAVSVPVDEPPEDELVALTLTLMFRLGDNSFRDVTGEKLFEEIYILNLSACMAWVVGGCLGWLRQLNAHGRNNQNKFANPEPKSQTRN